MQVKICGITRYEDAYTAATLGADMLGINFFKRSPRYITPDAALEICETLRSEMGADCPLLVGIFVNEVVGTISAITNKVGLNLAQLSGDESEDMLRELRGIGFKAIQPMNLDFALDDVRYFKPYFSQKADAPSLLLDAYHPKLYGGTGEQASVDVALAVKAEVPRMMLAGGLTPDNVAGRIAQIQPWGVDVASGVEVTDQPGIKDAAKMRDFIQAAQQAAQS